MRCARCKVRSYCSQGHQKADFLDHKPACGAVSKAQKRLDREEAKLRADPPGDNSMPGNPFENGVGHFWKIMETRNYMRARFRVVDMMGDIITYDSVQKQLEHTRDMLRLCRSDDMGNRYMVAPLYLRLNRDQECYDYIRWWCTTGEDPQYDRGNLDLGYLDVHNANAFEPISALTQEHSPLGMLSALTLLKLKLLLDLRGLKNSEDVPRSPIVSQNTALLQREDHTAEIHKLEGQVNQLFTLIHEGNPHFWKVLVHPGDLLDKNARPGMFMRGSVQEVQIVLAFSYDAWLETPGVLANIKLRHTAQVLFEGDHNPNLIP